MWFKGDVRLGDLPRSIHLFGEKSHMIFADRKTLTPLGEAHQFLREISTRKGISSKRQSARGIWFEYEIPELKMVMVLHTITMLLGTQLDREGALSPIKDAISVRDFMQITKDK